MELDLFALNLSLPEMATDLGVSTTSLQWVVSGYMVALATFPIPGGRLGDILGRKRMLTIGLGIFGLAALTLGMSRERSPLRPLSAPSGSWSCRL